MTLSPSGSNATAKEGGNFTLECSADVVTQQDSPPPSFEWFFGTTNTSLPSGVTVSAVTSSGNTYTSTLQFSPLLVSHAGLYTCRLGGNQKLSASTAVTVERNGAFFVRFDTHILYTLILVSDIPNPILSGSSPALTCTVELSPIVDIPLNISIVWTGPDKTDIADPISSVLKPLTRFSITIESVSISDHGEYTCTINTENGLQMFARRNITVGKC